MRTAAGQAAIVGSIATAFRNEGLAPISLCGSVCVPLHSITSDVIMVIVFPLNAAATPAAAGA
jgi:hypothetical protein